MQKSRVGTYPLGSKQLPYNVTPFQRLHAANHALICGSDAARSSNVPPSPMRHQRALQRLITDHEEGKVRVARFR
ncbi:hypothetical protein [Xanthomonas campestris]|uniref:hypothetical protein n=1 Tax=Xanthomonas campestris TaxID=339 RepID=UPI001CD6DC8F|nr:hypothetical protein [Xanthomonas campestris]